MYRDTCQIHNTERNEIKILFREIKDCIKSTRIRPKVSFLTLGKMEKQSLKISKKFF